MKKILLLLAVLAAFIPAASAQKVKEMHRFAIKGTDTLYVDRHIDLSKVKGDLIPTMIYMYGGGWAFGGRGGDFRETVGEMEQLTIYSPGMAFSGTSSQPPANSTRSGA